MSQEKLVVWFRNGELYKAQACSSRSWRRTANQWSEYAQLWNKRFGYEKNVIGIIPSGIIFDLIDVHKDLPKHTPPEKLKAQRDMRHFKDLPVRGRIM